MSKKTTKGEIIGFSILFVFIEYICLKAAMYFNTVPMFDFVDAWLSSILNPLDFCLTDQSLGFAGIGVVIELAVIVTYMQSRGNYRFGKEQGSASWGTWQEVNKHLSRGDIKLCGETVPGNTILTQHVQMSLNMGYPNKKHPQKGGTGRNLNQIVIGGSGSGKTLFFVKPNILQMNCSYVVVDPSAELMHGTGQVMANNGYRVKVLNLLDMENSDRYNPFEYLRNADDVMKLVEMFWDSTVEDGAQKGEPFWDDSGKNLLLSLIFVQLEKGNPLNFEVIGTMLSYAKVSDEHPDDPSPLDELMIKHNEDCQKQGIDSRAWWHYQGFLGGASKTKQTILQVINSKLFRTRSDNFIELTRKDEINFKGLWEEKTVLYLCIPSMDKTYNFLVAILYSQLFNAIDDQCVQHGYPLPIHVRFLMDEFANIAIPKNFENVLAVCRKYGFSLNIILQSLAQLKTIFEKDKWSGILGNCDTLLYLGSNETDTHKFLSERMGKETIDTKSSSLSRGSRGNYSENRQTAGRELMTVDEVNALNRGINCGVDKCLLFVRGEKDLIDDKYDTFSHPNFKYTMDADKRNEYHHIPQQQLDDMVANEEIFIPTEWEELLEEKPKTEQWEELLPDDKE